MKIKKGSTATYACFFDFGGGPLATATLGDARIECWERQRTNLLAGEFGAATLVNNAKRAEARLIRGFCPQ